MRRVAGIRRAAAAVTAVAASATVVGLSAVPAAAGTATAMRAAREAYLTGRYAEAVPLLRAHLRVAPRDAAAWVWLGASHYASGEIRPAIWAFESAALLDPAPEILLWLGAAYARGGRTTEAEQALQQARRADRGQAGVIAGQWLRALRGRRAPVLAKDDQAARYAWVVRWYNPSLSDVQVEVIVRSVLGYARMYEVDPRLVMALIAVESGFSISARSSAGAMGLGQLMPATARQLQVDPWDPVANIYGTVRYLRLQLDRFGGNTALALAAYNAGRGAVMRYGGIPPYRETQWYVVNVMALFGRLSGT
ncbi:MAG: transglycosylase SLT domain-containing protein [Armatimonadota bacterium]|nr:transglycosylase SLT domain-containing protein [Armatimonadota bacterium]MDR7450427.1 transglycosylase SLT domain-containing protein [Armatimonadota bacterium]MDR7466990.1 transglycosylase SLT domain-containing protein [Armatimonadota bacterium]MDR7493468.1 transglycosylase SLT domain-containing protein [Armatimonadota bacterium]MDR7498733.1 transglycosylase SLT domain-containing protein [Armatimonadota bacterium]